MAQESTKGWGGKRTGSGPATAVSGGTGEKHRITVSLGSDLLSALRTHRPDLADLTDQDLVRAAVWIASGEQRPRT